MSDHLDHVGLLACLWVIVYIMLTDVGRASLKGGQNHPLSCGS